MSKLMSSLVAATIVGAFSMSAFAATEAKPSSAADSRSGCQPLPQQKNPPLPPRKRTTVPRSTLPKLKRRSLTLLPPRLNPPRSNSCGPQKTALSGAVFLC